MCIHITELCRNALQPPLHGNWRRGRHAFTSIHIGHSQLLLSHTNLSDFSFGSYQTNSPLLIGLYSHNPFNVICCCLLDGKTKALILDFRVLSKMPNPDCFQDDQFLFPASPSCADSFAEGRDAVTTWERVTVAS